MNKLVLQPTDDTPRVVLDPANGIFEFSGKSLPEDVTTFYGPVLNWLDQYAQAPAAKTVVDIKLVYFNTASSKLILDILFKLEALHKVTGQVLVRWHYQDEDEDMKEAGEEYAELVEVPFEHVVSNA